MRTLLDVKACYILMCILPVAYWANSIAKTSNERLNYGLVKYGGIGRLWSTVAFLWKLSTSLYKKLSNFSVLPLIKRLLQLSCNDNIESYSIDVQYLKQRTANFSVGEKAVALLIDKVYTANRMEYQNVTFVDLTEDGACAQTVSTFVV